MHLPGRGPQPRPTQTSAGGGRAGRPRADGGNADWRRSSAHCPGAEGLKMEARPRFLRRRGAVVAPQAPSYLFPPSPSPPPSWCGARRLGDTHPKPCGTREPDRAEEAPGCTGVPPPPDSRLHQNRGPRSLGPRGVIYEYGSGARLGLTVTVKDVACLVCFYLSIYLITYFI